MTPLLFIVLAAFALALVHAIVVTGWRAAILARKPLEPAGTSDGALPLVSMIVPARNAAGTLQALLQDLHAQAYPRDRTEVIVVDDHSEDATAALAGDMALRWPQLTVLQLTDVEGKKAAITAGVERAKGDLVLVTDADGRCMPDRLPLLVAHWMRTHDDLVLMPVHTVGRGVLGGLQMEEQFAFQGATLGPGLTGMPLLANGANMAFTTAAFRRVRGFEGDRRSSGDDIFLMRRMVKAGLTIGCVADARAAVTVEAEPTWRGALSQRLRWAGKMRSGTGASSIGGAFALLLPFFLLAVTIVAARGFQIGQGVERTWLLIAAAWSLWLIPVLRLVNTVKRLLGAKPCSWCTIAALLVFPLYALPLALVSRSMRTRWKGRPVR